MNASAEYNTVGSWEGNVLGGVVKAGGAKFSVLALDTAFGSSEMGFLHVN